MPDLNFQVEEADAIPFAVSPQLAFRLRVTNAAANEPIHSIALRCQVQIEVARRAYGPRDEERLLDLFGTLDQWGRTLRPLLWTHAWVTVPAFSGNIVVDLPVPCSYDFNVAAVKYFAALEDGEVPLCLLFSGTVFYLAQDGAVQIAQVPWDKETTFRLPVRVWRQMMDHYYPNCAWLCLRKDVFDRLHVYKNRKGLPTWEQALESLLPPEESEDYVGTEAQHTHPKR
jgi:hypothetical protein